MLWTLFFLLVGTAGRARAAVWYVNDGSLAGDSYTSVAGHDANSGQTSDSPKRTIAAALALALAGDTILIDAGTYSEKVILDKDGLSLVGVDSNLTIIKVSDGTNPTSNSRGFFAESRSGLTIRNLRIVGAYEGIHFSDVTMSVVENVTATSNKFGFSLLNGSDSNSIRNCRTYSNSHIGIYLKQSSHNALTGNTSYRNVNSGIFTIDSSVNNSFIGNACNANKFGIYMAYGADANTLSGNTCNSNSHIGIYLNAGRENIISNNSTGLQTNSEKSAAGIFLIWNCDSNLISGNTANGNDNGIYLHGGCDSNMIIGNTANANIFGIRLTAQSSNNEVIGNTTDQNSHIGINIDDCTRSVVIGNQAGRNANSGIFLIHRADNTVIRGNTTDTGKFGVYMFGSGHLTVENNVARGNSHIGIYLKSCTGNVVTGNTATGNLNTGIFLIQNANDTVTGNTASGNANGIHAYTSTNGAVHGNRCEENTGIGIYINEADNYSVRNNLVRANRSSGIWLRAATECHVEQNTIDSNLRYQIEIDAGSTRDTIQKNNVLNHGANTMVNNASTSGYAFDLRRNWWGLTDSSTVRTRIKGAAASLVRYWPYRLGAVDTAPGADTVAPVAPDSVAAVGIDETSIRITWTAVGANEEASPFPVNLAGYRIYRASSATASQWELIGQTDNVTTTFLDDTGISPYGNYYYRVTAFDDWAPLTNESNYSDSVAMGIPIPNPNPWYINDGVFDGNDSFTTAPGDDANSGRTPNRPKRTIGAVWPFLTEGDTLYIDAGAFPTSARLVVSMNDISIIGVDSTLTVIDFNDTSLTGNKSIHASGQSNITIRDLAVVQGLHGVHFNNAHFSTVERVRANKNGRYGFLLEGSSNNTFTSNIVTKNLWIGIYSPSSSNNTFTSNTISGNSTFGIYLAGSSNCTLTANIVSGNASVGIHLVTSSNNNALTSNVVSGNSSIGIALRLSSSNNRLTSNVVSGNSGHGIYLASANGNTLTLNSVSGNSNSGVFLEASSNNILTSNIAAGNSGGGIGLFGAGAGWSSSGNSLAQNILDRNASWGLSISGTTTNDTFVKNVIITSAGRPDSGVAHGGISSAPFDFTRNVWMRNGILTTDSNIIQGMIGGYRDSIVFMPFRLGAVDTAPGADTVAPRAPVTVAAEALDSTRIRVTWSATATNEEPSPFPVSLAGYRVYRSPTAETSYWERIGEVDAGTLLFDDVGLAPATTYWYRITAFDDWTPCENESWYSDSSAAAATMASYYGPIWYVNDTSTAGDVFTTAIGSATGDGSPGAPFLRIDSALARISAGETILIDAGTYYPADSVVIPVNGVALIGVDSASTVIRLASRTTANGFSIYASGRSGLVFRDFQVTNGYIGINLAADVTSSLIERVWTTEHGQTYGYGIAIAGDSNTISNCLASSVTGVGIVMQGNHHNVIGNTSSGNGYEGFAMVGAGTDTNLFTGNRATGNGWHGFQFNNTHGNTVTENVASGNFRRGFHLQSAHHNAFFGNVASSNAWHGFFLEAGSDSNLFTHNSVTGNSQNGFHLSSSSNNFFAQNTTDSNIQWAVYLDGTSSNDTFHKNIILPPPARPDSVVFNATANRFNFSRNWWGMTDSATIRAKILGVGAAKIQYIPFRLGPVDTAPGADTVAPRAPDTVAAVALDSARIRVTWSATATNEEPSPFPVSLAGYRVYRSPTADTSYWERIGEVDAGTLLFDDVGLAPATTYWYRITAFDDRAPYENESWYSDSIVEAATTASYFGPIWHVNDTSTMGDVFTTAIGSATGDGSPGAPFLRIDSALARISAGETILIDAGTYWPTESLRIETNSVFFIGADSTLTVIDFAASGSVYAADVSYLTLRGFAVNNGMQNIWFHNVGFSTIDGVRTRWPKHFWGSSIYLFQSSNNVVRSSEVDGAIFLEVADNNLLTGISYRFVAPDTYAGFYLYQSDNNTITSNDLRETRAWIGIGESNDNKISGNQFMNVVDGDGIDMWESNGNVIEFNTISISNTALGGFSIRNSNNTLIRDNIFSFRNIGKGLVFLQAENNVVINNLILTDSMPAIRFYINGSNNFLSQNSFVYSGAAASPAILLETAASGNLFTKNNISCDSVLHTILFDTISFTRNWWGTADSAVIRARLSGPGADSIIYIPFRLGPVDTAPGADTVAPRAPDTVAAVALDSARIRVTWSATATNEEPSPFPVSLAGYRVYRSPTVDTSYWERIGEVAAGTLLFDDAGLAPATTYWYRITAFDDWTPRENESWYSDSTASAATTASYFGPIWHVNDTSTAGDVFTTAIGSATGDGSPGAPFLRIDSALARISAGETILIDAGIYFETVHLENLIAVSLIGADSNATILVGMGGGQGSVLNIRGMNDLKIENLQVRNGDNGISMYNSHNIALHAITSCSNVGAPAAQLGRGINVDSCSIISITNSRVAYNLWIGLIFSSSRMITATGVLAEGNAGDGIRVIHSTAGSSYTESVILIGNNSCNNGAAGFYLNSATGLYVANNLASDNKVEGFNVQQARSSGALLINNIARGSNPTGNYGAAGFAFVGVSGCTVIGNRSENNRGAGFSILANGFLFESNVATGNIAGITSPTGFLLLSGCDGNQFRMNLSQNNAASGFSFASSTNSTMVGNVAQNNANGGFAVSGGSNLAFLDNTAEANGGYGLSIVSSNANTIAGNRLLNNAERGLFLSNATGQFVRRNTLFPNLKKSVLISGVADNCIVDRNNLAAGASNETDYVRHDGSGTIAFRRNWWGTTDSAVIRARLSGPGADSIIYIPFRLGPVDTAPGADTVAPRAPDTVAAVALDSARIRVSWAPVTTSEEPEAAVGLAGYRIYRSPTAETSLWVLRGGAASTALSFTDSGIANGDTWYYRVTAYDNHSPYPNESWYSDSICSAVTGAGRVWYLNDNSQVNDSFTSAIGRDTADGLSNATPKRTFGALMPLLQAGDVVYIDAGTYWPSETITIPANGIAFIGKDSSATGTVIDFADSTEANARCIHAHGLSNLLLRDFLVMRGLHGVWWRNVDSSTITRVQADSCGSTGILLDTGSPGCDSVAVSGCGARGNRVGFALNGATNCRLTDNVATANRDAGFQLDAAVRNALRNNRAHDNAIAGFRLTNSAENDLIDNEASSDRGWLYYIAGAKSGGNKFIGNRIVSSGRDSGVYDDENRNIHFTVIDNSPPPGARSPGLRLKARLYDTRLGREVDVIADEIIIKYRVSATEAGKDRVRANKALTRLRQSTLPRMERLLAAPGTDLNALIDDLKRYPEVEYVEPNYAAEALAWPPDDPRVGEQWGLTSIGVPDAWNVTTGDANVIIAVLDSGIDSGHPDLTARIVPGYNFIADNTVTLDDNSHGTLVAGVIVARANNGVGIVGVAPQCRAMPVKVLDRNGIGSYADVADGIVYAADHGARVINLSLGGTSPSQYLQDAVDYAYGRGCVVVAAAGNQNTDNPLYPASCLNVLSVAAVDSSGEKASFSNYGEGIDIAAPGVNILSTDSGHVWRSVNGTSFAAPFVSGQAALIFSRYPASTASEVIGRMLNSATDIGPVGRDVYFGYGLANCPASLSAGTEEQLPVDTRVVTPTATVMRPLTMDEIARMRAIVGVFDPDVNYNELIDGHGTGLAPPSEEDWVRMQAVAMMTESLGEPEYQVRDLAAFHDNSTTAWFPPIGNQGGEGSCTAWSIVYYIKTFQEAKEHGWDLSGADWVNWAPTVSYQDRIFSPEFVYHQVNFGLNQGCWQWNVISIINRIGAATWAKNPNNRFDYSTWPPEAAWREAPLFRSQSEINYLEVTSDTGVTTLKTLLFNGNLASINIHASLYSKLDANDLCTIDNRGDELSLNHANTVVGYDDDFGPYTEEGESRTGAFKVANSWGKGFTGDHNSDGFWWISYGAIKTMFWPWAYYYTDSIAYNPRLVAVTRVSHEKRGDCNLGFGLSDTMTPTATKTYNCSQGGNFAFPGNNMVIDLTELLSALPGETQAFMSVYDRSSNATTGSARSFTLEYYNTYDSSGARPDSIFESPDVPRSTANNCTTYVRNFIDAYVPNNWYVNDGSTVGDAFCSAIGNDANDGLTPATPKRTIAAVTLRLSPGDTINIDAGTYAEAVVISRDSIALIGAGAYQAGPPGGLTWRTIIDPPGSATTAGRYAIHADTQSGLQIRDLQVQGAEYGIKFVNVDRSMIDNVMMRSNKFGMSLENGSSMNTIQNCSAIANAHVGIYIKESSDNLLQNNHLTFNANSGIFLINRSDSNSIIGNTASSNKFGIYVAGASNRNLVNGNRADLNSHIGIYFNKSCSNTITGNIACRNVNSGIFSIWYSDSNLFTNNVADSNKFGIYFYGGCRGNVVRNNHARGNSHIGLYAKHCYQTVMDSNYTAGNSNTGIYYYNGGVGDSITNNIVTQNGWYGICVYKSSGGVVDSNVITNGTGIGLYLYDAGRMRVSHNLVSRVTGTGLWLRGCSNVIVALNTIESSTLYQIAVDKSASSDTVTDCNIISRGASDKLVYCNSSSGIPLNFKNNWWGTNDPGWINSRIVGATRHLIDTDPIAVGEVDTSTAEPPPPGGPPDEPPAALMAMEVFVMGDMVLSPVPPDDEAALAASEAAAPGVAETDDFIPPSPEIETFTRAAPRDTAPPLPPFNLTARVLETRAILLKWDQSPSTDVSGYTVCWNAGVDTFPTVPLGFLASDRRAAYSWLTDTFAPGFYGFRVQTIDHDGFTDRNATVLNVRINSLSDSNPVSTTIGTPQAGKIVNRTGSIQVVADISGATPQLASITHALFQYRVPGGTWKDMAVPATMGNPVAWNRKGAVSTYWDASAVAPGRVEIRALPMANALKHETGAARITIALTDSKRDADISNDVSVANDTAAVSQIIHANRADTAFTSTPSGIQVTVIIPIGAAPPAPDTDPVRIEVVITPRSPVETSTMARGAIPVGITAEVFFSNRGQPGIPVSIIIPLPGLASDGTILVDGKRVPAASLQAWAWSADTGRWEQLDPPIIDLALGVARVSARHFSFFTLVAPVPVVANLATFTVYPNPFKPNDGHALTGVEYNGAANTGITFENLPPGSQIRIYTALGELIAEFLTDASGGAQWDVRNRRNDKVASGVYVYIVTAPNGERRIGKIAVMR